MKMPHTYFSTELRGGARETARRLKNLMDTAPKRRGLAALGVLVALVAVLACFVALRPAETEAEDIARARFDEALGVAEHYVLSPMLSGLEPEPARDGWTHCVHYETSDALRAATLDCFSQGLADSFLPLLGEGYEDRPDGLYANIASGFFDVSPWQEGVADPETLTVTESDEGHILFHMTCEYTRGDPVMRWFLLNLEDGQWRFVNAFDKENPLPRPDEQEVRIRALLAALPDARPLAVGTWTGASTTTQLPGQVVVSYTFATDDPKARDVVLGRFANGSSEVLGQPARVRVSKDQYTLPAGDGHTAWFLYTYESGDKRDSNILENSGAEWKPLLHTQPEYWEDHRGDLRPMDAAIEFSYRDSSTGEWIPSHMLSVAHYLGPAPAVQNAAQALARELGAEDVEVLFLHPTGGWQYWLSVSPLEIYYLEWADREPYSLVFSRPEDGVFEYLGAAPAPEEISSTNAAIQVLSGIRNMELAFTTQGQRNRYYGLGGAEAAPLADGKTPYEVVRHDDWPPLTEGGGYWEELKWYGLYALRYVSADPDAPPVITRLTTWLRSVSTARGVRVGDHREQVLERYPEASDAPLRDYQGDYLWWGSGGDALIFHFTDDAVSQLELVHFTD